MDGGEITEGPVEDNHECLERLRMRLAQGHLPFHFATEGRLALCVYYKSVKFIYLFLKIISPEKNQSKSKTLCVCELMSQYDPEWDRQTDVRGQAA